MGTERHYTEEEIAAVFRKAAEAQEAARRERPQGEGLTLAEMQQIGASVGLDPDFVARAAAGLDHRVMPAPRRNYLGVPIGVGRSVALPGPLSDAAWERLVVDLRETFQARGEVRQEGAFRQWTNGNLQVLVEPGEAGHRLRMRTTSANLRAQLSASGMMLVMMLVVFLSLLLSGNPLQSVVAKSSFFLLIGSALMGVVLFKAPRWATEREQQMEAIAARAIELAHPSSPALPQPEARIELGEPEISDAAAVRVRPRVR